MGYVNPLEGIPLIPGIFQLPTLMDIHSPAPLQGWRAPLRDHHWAASYRIISILRLGAPKGWMEGPGRLDEFFWGGWIWCRLGGGWDIWYSSCFCLNTFGVILKLGSSLVLATCFCFGTGFPLFQSNFIDKLLFPSWRSSLIIIPIPLHNSRSPTSSSSFTSFYFVTFWNPS